MGKGDPDYHSMLTKTSGSDKRPMQTWQDNSFRGNANVRRPGTPAFLAQLMSAVTMLSLLATENASAKTKLFQELAATTPCGGQVQAFVSDFIARQTWLPEEEPAEKSTPIVFHDTRGTSGVRTLRLAVSSADAVLRETILPWYPGDEKETVYSWRSEDNCTLKQSSLVRKRAEIPTSGFTDVDLEGRLLNNYWGLIFVSKLDKGALGALRELKVAVDAMPDLTSGSLTIVLSPGEPEQRQLHKDLLNTLGVETFDHDLKAAASPVLSLHKRVEDSAVSPVLLIYQAGLISNRDLTGSFGRETYRAWIAAERAQLEMDNAR